jgi:hypothetical protein
MRKLAIVDDADAEAPAAVPSAVAAPAELPASEADKPAAAAAEKTAHGIVATARSEAQLVKNQIYGNAKAGLMIVGGACPWVEDNMLRDGQAAGILVSEASSGVLRSNTMRGHAKTEVQVCDAGTQPLVEGNTISESRAGGILVFRGAAAIVRKNTVRANAGANVRLAEGCVARLEGNTIADGEDCGVAVCSGALAVLADNTINGVHKKAGVLIYGTRTAPTLLRNVIEGSEQAGVYMYAGAQATIEDCEIRGNAGPNMIITEGSDPLLHKCTIHSSDDAGVLVHQEGKGTLQHNNVYNNRTYGMVVLTGGCSLIRKNWLHGRRQGGLLVDEGGVPEVAENTIDNNSKAGVTLRGACQPHIHHNKICNGRDSGVHALEVARASTRARGTRVPTSVVCRDGQPETVCRASRAYASSLRRALFVVLQGGGGTIEYNDVFGNERAGFGIETGASPLIRHNKIYNGQEAGVFYFDGGMGTFEENEVWGNQDAGVQIIEASDPLVQRNRLQKQALPDGDKPWIPVGERAPDPATAKAPKNKDVKHKEIAPLWIHSGGFGNIQDNEITASDWHGVAIGSQAQPTLQANRIHANRKAGVFMQDGAMPTLIENDIYKNWVGVEVIEHSQPTLRGNKIHHSRVGGIWVYKEAKCGAHASAALPPTCLMARCPASRLLLSAAGVLTALRGLYEGNDIHSCMKANVRVWELGDPTMQGNKIHSGRACGILIYECGKGHFIDNDIYDKCACPSLRRACYVLRDAASRSNGARR